MEISLKPVTVHNWYSCTQLEVAEDQNKYSCRDGTVS